MIPAKGGGGEGGEGKLQISYYADNLSLRIPYTQYIYIVLIVFWLECTSYRGVEYSEQHKDGGGDLCRYLKPHPLLPRPHLTFVQKMLRSVLCQKKKREIYANSENTLCK